VRILLDACVWGKARQALTDAGHDVVWVGDWTRDPGDQEILGRAVAEGRVLVTLDKDFGELVVVRGEPHRGIIRLVGISAMQQAAAVLALLDRYGEAVLSTAVVTVEPGRVRIRPPEPDWDALGFKVVKESEQ